MDDPKERDWEETTLPASRVFGFRLRERREAQGFTLDGLAGRMRQYGDPISKRALHEIERGPRKLSLDEAFALTYVLRAVPANMLIPPEGQLVRLSAGFACDGSSVRTWLSSGLRYRSDQPPAPEIANDVRREHSDSELARFAQNLIDGYRLSPDDGRQALKQAFLDMARAIDVRRREEAQED